MCCLVVVLVERDEHDSFSSFQRYSLRSVFTYQQVADVIQMPGDCLVTATDRT